MARHKKMKARKATGFHKMDSAKKRSPDYTDIAYREAVSRLRYLLAESYSPQATPTKISHVRSNKHEDSGDETDASMAVSDRSRQRHHHHVHAPPSPYRSPYFGAKRSLYTDIIPKPSLSTTTLQVPKIVEGTGSTIPGTKSETQQPPPELMAFIERQEDYIEQLEKESQYCREELTSLLSKVKDVISENEGLHEKEKSGILKSVFEYLTSGEEEEEDDEEDELEEKRDRKKSPTKKKRLEGPSIVFESRISELEAQLTQTKIELRKAQEEAETLKKKYGGLEPGSSDSLSPHNTDACRKQVEMLQREKEELAENLAKLSSAVSHMRDKEADASHKVKRSFDMMDQAQFEKAQAELEVRRLKDELERQHEKLRDLLQEQGRRVQDERTQAERRYAQQVEQLTCDLSAQWDTAGKLQLELEKQRRTESELRRELQQKAVIIEELKKELQTKIAGLQSEATQSAAERGSLEQELAASRLVTERAEREARQESARLQAEITALRQRLDRADADLLHSRRENLRLSEQIASLERELNLAKMMKDGSEKTTEKTGEGSSPNKSREKELTSMIMNMEAKHVQTVGELESMIQSQTDLMEKLKDECRSLTQKLEESSARHKEEMAGLQSNVGYLSNKLEAFEAQDWRDDNYVEGNERGPEHGFALDQQYEQQPQYEAPQPAFESQSEYEPQRGYETEQPSAYPQHDQQEYAPQSTYQSQPEQEYAPQSTYQSQPEYDQHEQEYAVQQSTYQSQPEYDQREQEYAQQPTYQPQSEFNQHEQDYKHQPTFESQPEYQPTEQYQSQPNYSAESGYRPDSDYRANTEQQLNYEQQPEYMPQSDYGATQPQYQAPEPQYQPQSQPPYQQGSPSRELYTGSPRHQQTFRKQSSSEHVPPSPRRSRPVSRQGSGSDQLPPVSPSTPTRFFRQGSSELPPRSPSRAAFAARKQSSTDLQQSQNYALSSNYQAQQGIEPSLPYTDQPGAYEDKQQTEYIAESQPRLSRQPSAESHIGSRPPSVEPQWQGPGPNVSLQGPPTPQP